jgi:hypothetical protein
MTKRPEEIALMAEAGKLLASVFSYLDQFSLAGMSTLQVNDMVDSFIVHQLSASGQQGAVRLCLCAEFLAQQCGVPRRAVRHRYPAGWRHRQFRHHAGKAWLHCRFQQDLSGRRRFSHGPPPGADHV